MVLVDTGGYFFLRGQGVLLSVWDWDWDRMSSSIELYGLNVDIVEFRVEERVGEK